MQICELKGKAGCYLGAFEEIGRSPFERRASYKEKEERWIGAKG
jgi:hypothetical protein